MASPVGVLWIVVPFALMLIFRLRESARRGWADRRESRLSRPRRLHAFMAGEIGIRVFMTHTRLIDKDGFALLVVIIFAASLRIAGAFPTMLSIAVVLQLIPFIYMFAALLKFSLVPAKPRR